MWYLTSESEDPRVLYISPQSKQMTVGRNAEGQNVFGIVNDSSISRKHAVFSVSSDNSLYLEDLGSRYGTFVNDGSAKLEPNVMTKINLNNRIKFGKLNCIWRVHFITFCTCTSTLSGENLLNLKATVTQLGGLVKSEWDDTCKYLTMPAITLTIKVVLALAQASCIVTIDFWKKTLEAVTNATPLPDPKNFTPKIVESTLNKENFSLLPDNKRKTLFAGKKFVFFSKKQHDMYKPVVLKASATAVLLSEVLMTKSQLCEPNVIVVQYIPTTLTQETANQKNKMEDITEHLKAKGKRLVADAEIGLAILYCSINKYCNPDFNFSSEVVKQTVETKKKSTVIAQETQESTGTPKKVNIVIDETLTSNSSLKRKVDDDIETQQNATKKIAIDKTESNIENYKRKADDDDIQTNPTKKMTVDNDDSEDCFNFTKSSCNNKENTSNGNKLFFKPLKRKALSANKDEEEPFNFIESENEQDKKKQCLFNNKEKNDDDIIDECDSNTKVTKKPYDILNNQQISAMRGTKLKELMENLSNIQYNSEMPIKIKTEVTDELNTKLNELDLGTTVIKVRNDLIIKKEPIYITEKEECVKNFKKFVKVWPVNSNRSNASEKVA